jgi:pSer/pThr/pTyr-binding forkhead associated (FHA) protein
MSASFPHLVPVHSRAQGVLDDSAIRLDVGETVLGRDVGTGVLGFEGDTLVSRRHALVRISAEPWRVELVDLESKNGTFVNGRALGSQFLVDGDLLRIGETFFVFRLSADSAERPSELPGRSPAMERLRNQLEPLNVHSPWVLLTGVDGTDFDPAIEAVNRRVNPEGSVERVTAAGLRAALSGVATVVVHNIECLGQDAISALLEHKGLAPVIATTTRDLEAMKNSGGFDAGLFTRLADAVLRVPPLRERREDLPRMIVDLLGDDAPSPTTDLIETLLLYCWEGDMEELVSVAADLRVRGAGLDALMTDLVSPRLRGTLSSMPSNEDSMTQVEIRRPVPSRPDLEGVLALHDGDLDAVAEALGRSRMQVMAWIQQYGLDADEA